MSEKFVYKVRSEPVKIFGKVPPEIFLVLKNSGIFGPNFDEWLTKALVAQLIKDGLVERKTKPKGGE